MNPSLRAILILAVTTGLAIESVTYLEQQQTAGSVPGASANCTLLVCPQAVSISLQSYDFSSPTNVTLIVKNTGVLSDGLINYAVGDNQGNQWWRIWLPPNESTGTWWNGPVLRPNATGTPSITIGSSCGNCTYRGSAGAFTQFMDHSSYAVTVITGRGYQFTFAIHA